MNTRSSRLLSMGCFLVAAIFVVAAMAHADTPAPPTINVVDVPESPTPLPKLVATANRFALASSPAPEASTGADGSQGGISLIATSYDHANESNSCAIIVDNGQVETRCVGDAIGKVRLAAVDSDQDGIELSDGRHIGVANDTSQALNAEVPGVASGGLPAQTVPISVAPAGGGGALPQSNLARPGAATNGYGSNIVPAAGTNSSGNGILNALGIPMGPTSGGAATAPQGIPTPTILSPNALPTPSFVNP